MPTRIVLASAGNAYVTDIDIVIACSEITSSVNAQGDVRATGCVANQSASFTAGRVVVAGGIAKERVNAIGRIVAAGGIVAERLHTGGRVIAASGVVKERMRTIGRVVAAGCVAKERFKTVGCVVVAGCVAKERSDTVGRVEAAGGVAKERSNPLAVLTCRSYCFGAPQNRWLCCCCRWCC